MEMALEGKYQEAIRCLKENVEVLSEQQEFLQGLKKLEFQHRKKERLMEIRLEQQWKEIQEVSKRIQDKEGDIEKRLEEVSKRIQDKEGDIEKRLEELRKKVSNPDYSFRVKEDIYARFQFPWAAVEPGSRVLLYGGGIVGKIFLEQLSKSSYCNVVAVCDKNPSKTGIQALPVITLRDLARMEESSYDMILIAIEKKTDAMEIKGEMELAGIPGEKIRWFDPARR